MALQSFTIDLRQMKSSKVVKSIKLRYSSLESGSLGMKFLFHFDIMEAKFALSSVSGIIDIMSKPTHVILDLGCTRCMASMGAMKAFEQAAAAHGITCVWKPCCTKRACPFVDVLSIVCRLCIELSNCC